MMRYIPTDKYTVAWFKLAECVAKGEKEKAFGVYRLLMYSLEDKAYAHQLEGDLLGAFQDERALEKYEHAAQLYMTNNRWKEAIGLYEELALMNSDNARAVHCLIELYTKYKKPEQYACRVIYLVQSFYAKKWFSHFEKLIDALPACVILDEAIQSAITLSIQVAKKNDLESRVIEKLIDKTVAYIIIKSHNTILSQFLLELEQINKHWYQHAQRSAATCQSK